MLCLWSQWLSRCCFHSCVLCLLISDVMLSLVSLRVGFCGFNLRVLFLLSMSALMFSGRSLHVCLIFPFGMCLLPACSRISVKMLFAVWTSVMGAVLLNSCSVSAVYVSQSALL